MKRVLFISNHAGFSKFNAPYMKWFKEQGWAVDNISPGIEIADYVDNQYDIAIIRNPLSLINVLAYGAVKRIIQENNYAIIHCHTPVGGVLGRLCSIKARKKGASVVYTAHGFHFYNGSSLITWIIYYNIEKILARYTDCIVTINEEDFSLAKRQFCTGSIFKINGVGVNLQRFKALTSNENKMELRKNYGFKNDDFILIYVAQFVSRKNHSFIITQLPLLLQKISSLKILFVGNGYLMEKCKSLIKKQVLNGHVLFLGYRSDIDNLYSLSDILLSVSKQEGLPQNLVEGMACGLPVVCSKIRGHVDIVKPSVNGFLFQLDNADDMNERIYQLYTDKPLRETISKQNIIDAEQFSVTNSVNAMSIIYQQFM